MSIIHTFKYIILGDSGVGKTSLVKRYIKNMWDEEIMETIGVAFEVTTCDISDTKVKLHIWDTAGQERYRSLTKMYYRDTMGIICVFDLTSNTSYTQIMKWIIDIRDNCDDSTQIIIVGNKSDLLNSRFAIQGNKIKDYCKNNSIPYFEVSAKTDSRLYHRLATRESSKNS